MSDWMNDLNEMQRYYTLRREAERHRLVCQALEGRQGDRGSIAGLFVGLGIACPSLENLCKSVMETMLLP